MQELQLIKKYGLLFSIGFFGLFFCMILLFSSTTNSSESTAVSITLQVPFEDNVNYVITSLFGERQDPIEPEKTKFHKGIDLAAPDGTNIVSSYDGVIISTGNSEELGNYVYIEHNVSGIKVYTLYAHMLDDSIVVKTGQKVKTKEKIGVIGSTGKSTGTHLHFVICIHQLSFELEYLLDPINVIEGL